MSTVGIDRFAGGLANLFVFGLEARAVVGIVDFRESIYASSVGVLRSVSLRFAIGWSGSGTKCTFLGRKIEKSGGRFSSNQLRPVSRSLLVVMNKILPAVSVGSMLVHHSLSRKISFSVFVHGRCSASRVSMRSSSASSGMPMTGMVATAVRYALLVRMSCL